VGTSESEKKETLSPCVSCVFRDLEVEVEIKSYLNVKYILQWN